MLDRYIKKTKGKKLKTIDPSQSYHLSQKFMKNLFKTITPLVDNFLSEFISAYRKAYSTNLVLLRLIEQWKSALDNINFAGALLIDLPKAFDYIRHDLLIAKLHALVKTALLFFYYYLK